MVTEGDHHVAFVVLDVDWGGLSRPLEDPGNRIVAVGGEVLERDQLVLQAQMLAEYLGDLLPGCLVQRRLRVT